MTEAWSYGVDGSRYPVADRDVWRVGEHLLACGDLERGDGLRVVQYGLRHYGAPPAMFYSDPPWDKGNAKAFRTKAGQPLDVDFDRLMGRVFEAAAQVAGDVYAEMGQRHWGDVAGWMGRAGIQFVSVTPITYMRKHVCYLAVGTRAGALRAGALPDFSGMDDERTPGAAMEVSSKPGDVVLETCMGLGCTARNAQRLGRRALGLELHPRRLERTIIELVDKYGLRAEKVGEL